MAKSKSIQIGSLRMPVEEYAVSSTAILGIRDSGKTVTAKGIAEQLLAHRVPIVVYDAVGKWRFLKNAGLGPGYRVVVAGGRDPDLPLTPHSAPAIVRAAIRESIPLIIDLFSPSLSKSDWRQIVQETIRIIHYENEGLRHIFLEEAPEYCLDSLTEVLTKNGWKRLRDCSVGEKISCFDMKRQVYRWDVVTRVVRKHFRGKMVRIKSKDVDILMTPDHRAVIKRRQHVPARYKIYPPSFCLAAKLPRSFLIPHGGAATGRGVRISDDLLRVIGWTATDGSFHSSQHRYICISQSSATHKLGVCTVEKMRNVLLPMGASESVRCRRDRFIAGSKRVTRSKPDSTFFLGPKLSQSIRAFVGHDIHRIPRKLINECNTRQLQILWESLLEGDGSSSAGRWRFFYPGHDEGLADDFQEISLRLGVRTVKSFRNGQWKVSIASEKSTHWISKPGQKFREPYAGMTYCVTVPTGAFVARRNGRTFVTGNCPQRVIDGNTYAEIEKLVRMGGNASVGITLIGQRSQEINKAVLDLCHTLILGCQVGSKAIETLEQWMDRLSPDTAEELVKSLPKLGAGEVWVWTKARPDRPVREQMPMCRSLHPDRRTPIAVTAAKSASIDVGTFVSQLTLQIPKVVEEAKANDPAALRKVIDDLRKQLAKQPAPAATPAKVVEKPIWTSKDIGRLESSVSRLEAALGELSNGLLTKAIQPIQQILQKVDAAPIHQAAATSRTELPVCSVQAAKPPAAARQPAITPSEEGDFKLGKGGPLRMLKALVRQHPAPCTEGQWAILSRLKRRSGTWRTYKSRLIGAGLVAEVSGDMVVATELAMQRYGHLVAAEIGESSGDLITDWKRKLGRGPARMLDALAAHPQGMLKEELGNLTDLKAGTGTFRTYLSRLNRSGLIRIDHDRVSLSSELQTL